MTITKPQIFILGLTLILGIFFIPRLLWLSHSVKTKAVVLYIDQTRYFRSQRQSYPVFQYYTETSRVTVAGAYNLPYQVGDSVNIRYNPNKHFDMRIDDFKGLWIGRLMWLVPVLFVWILLFTPKDFSFSITITGEKMKVNFG